MNPLLPEAPVVEEVSTSRFEDMVEEAVADLPPRFRRKLDNVHFVVEDTPSPEQRRQQGLGEDETLLGLYEGVPLPERAHYSFVPPDRITIFRLPIQRRSRSPEELEEMVRETVYHEIAHHFGMDEERVRRAEQERHDVEE